ncbi:MAG: RDD family protein [Limisphaerales bacterium]
MSWYYAVGQEQKGPVTEDQLHTLAKDGVVTDDTMVWSDGMANWQAYRDVRGGGAAATPAAGGVVCAQCAQTFSADQVMRVGEQFVCAACKPAFVQRMQEGAAQPGTLTYATFWIRFGAKFIDGILLQIIGGIMGFVLGLAFSGGLAQNPAYLALFYVLGFGLEVVYKTIFIGMTGATPGKMACKLRVVNADGSKVSYAKACGRAFAELLSAMICLGGYIMAAFDDEKRALHDRICDTRVIKVG